LGLFPAYLNSIPCWLPPLAPFRAAELVEQEFSRVEEEYEVLEPLMRGIETEQVCMVMLQSMVSNHSTVNDVQSQHSTNNNDSTVHG
jgi:hypothetical protein